MAPTDQTLTLPAEIDDIDSAFVSAALAQGYPQTVVDSVEVGDLRQGSASSLRLKLGFGANPHSLPATMFMKGDFIHHEYTPAAAFAGEALYFSHIAEALDDAVRQPRAYYAGVDDDRQAIVILEDLGRRNVRFGDCDEPLDTDTVADGVRQLAAMQAHYWQGRGLAAFDWITDVGSVAALMMFLVQPDHFDDYIARERATFLSPELKDRAKIQDGLQAMFETDKSLPSAFVHGDAHLGNTFRAPDGTLGFCDFQAIGRGPYIWDVTYFLTGALTPDDRSASERELLTMYLDELRRHGADDVPAFDAAFLAHRQHMMHGYLNILTPTQMQPDRFAVAMGHRFAAAMADLDTLASFG